MKSFHASERETFLTLLVDEWNLLCCTLVRYKLRHINHDIKVFKSSLHNIIIILLKYYNL